MIANKDTIILDKVQIARGHNTFARLFRNFHLRDQYECTPFCPTTAKFFHTKARLFPYLCAPILVHEATVRDARYFRYVCDCTDLSFPMKLNTDAWV